MTEEDFGRAWAALARLEGHMKRLPPSAPKELRVHPKASEIASLKSQGAKHEDIGRAVGLSKARVTQILRDMAA